MTVLDLVGMFQYSGGITYRYVYLHLTYIIQNLL